MLLTIFSAVFSFSRLIASISDNDIEMKSGFSPNPASRHCGFRFYTANKVEKDIWIDVHFGATLE
jgi:hypothetical protein